MNIQDRIANLLQNSAGNLSIPARNCNFVMTFLNEGTSDIVLLKSFTFPEAGISFSMASETLFFPIPTLSCSPITIEGYILLNTGKNLLERYRSQFSNGLLSLKPGIQIGIYLYVPSEELDAPATLANIYRNGMNESLNLDSFGGHVVTELDISQYPQHDDSDIVIPLFVLKGCKFSQPHTTPNPASNEFATLITNVSYINFHTLF